MFTSLDWPSGVWGSKVMVKKQNVRKNLKMYFFQLLGWRIYFRYAYGKFLLKTKDFRSLISLFALFVSQINVFRGVLSFAIVVLPVLVKL